ncbi:MAG TPA: response regulator, partial [Steroidobacteraceae bacterium]|nr:response regulator [Steroidobacteraceae bacterium]
MSAAVRLKVLIVDDEPPARERLRSLLAEIAEVDVVGEAVSGAEALAHTHDLAPDIVLLDVRMPGMNGLEAARHLSVLEEPPAVIFTTAYDEYAVEAFEAHAAGYLLKPVRKEQLAAALTRAGRLTRAQLQKLAAAGGEAARRTH